jgi:hypothetical protein
MVNRYGYIRRCGGLFDDLMMLARYLPADTEEN